MAVNASNLFDVRLTKKIPKKTTPAINTSSVMPTHQLSSESQAYYFALYSAKNTDNPSDSLFIINHFQSNIMTKNIFLRDHRLIGYVLESCSTWHYADFAESVWNYITKERKCLIEKPNQFLYSKMMRVYHRRPLAAEMLVDQWMEQYLCDSISLKGHLRHLQLRSPVILNQMMRCLMEIRASKHQIIQYFVKMIDLDICGDNNTKKILMELRTKITGTECVGFIARSKSLKVSAWIIKNLLFRIIPKVRYKQFDAAHNFTISQQLKLLEEPQGPDGGADYQLLLDFMKNDRIPDDKVYQIRGMSNNQFIQLFTAAKSIKCAYWLLENILFCRIDRCKVLKWDEKHNRTVTSHIKQLDSTGLAYFRLHFYSRQD